MVTELQTRLAFRREVNELGVGMSVTDVMPPRLRNRIRRVTNRIRRQRPVVHDDGLRARALGAWLSKAFDYDEPPTLAEMLDAHPRYHTADEMRVHLHLAQLNGYIVWRDSAEGAVFLPGPKLR